MPNYTRDQIRLLCREQLVAAGDVIKKNTRFEERLEQIVSENISSGRFERVASARAKRHSLTLNQYIDRVSFCLDHESPRMQALQCEDNEEWQRLGNFLSKRAQRLLRRFRDGSQVEAEAFDFAQETCLVIFEARYPFDVPFEAWATTILNRQILARYTRSKDAANRPQAPDSLDGPSNPNRGDSDSLAELLADPRSLEPFERIEIQAELRNAIGMLRSSSQREVIIATYFEGLDNDQIAKRLGKTKQAVYGLRLRGLARLKVLLGDEPSKRIRGKNA